MIFFRNNLEVRVENRIEAISRLWNEFEFLPEHLNSRYLLALEESNPRDMEFRYVMVRREQKLLACAYLQVVNFSGKNFEGHAPWPLLLILKFFFRFKNFRLIFCGNLFRTDFPCLFYDEGAIGFEDVVSLLKDLLKRENGDLLMLKEVKASEHHRNLLSSLDFNKYEEDKAMAMDLPGEWSTFNDYLSSLTKKYRKRVRRIRGKGENILVREIGEEEMLRRLSRIGDLFNQTASRQFLKMGLVDGQYFVSLKKALGESMVFRGYFHEDELIAFSTHLNHPETLEVHYIGIDYSFNNRHCLYFNILYDGLEQAITLQKQRLDLGRTAREAKASLGCEPVPSKDYLFVSNRWVVFFIRIFERLFRNKMGDQWESRNPLKKNGVKMEPSVFPA